MSDEKESNKVLKKKNLKKGCYLIMKDSIERNSRIIGNKKERVWRDGERKRDEMIMKEGKMVRIEVKDIIRWRNM